MTGPTADVNSLDRLSVIGRIDFDSPALRAELDRLSARTAQRTGMPVSAVTLVLSTAQLFVGSAGMPAFIQESGGTPIEWSFCVDVVTSGRQYIAENLYSDLGHADNPMVTGRMVGCYAGVPVTVDGEIVGAHCVMAATPTSFSEEQLGELFRSAQQVSELLQQYSLR
jgi:GAF domain-containing protein